MPCRRRANPFPASTRRLGAPGRSAPSSNSSPYRSRLEGGKRNCWQQCRGRGLPTTSLLSWQHHARRIILHVCGSPAATHGPSWCKNFRMTLVGQSTLEQVWIRSWCYAAGQSGRIHRRIAIFRLRHPPTHRTKVSAAWDSGRRARESGQPEIHTSLARQVPPQRQS